MKPFFKFLPHGTLVLTLIVFRPSTAFAGGSEFYITATRGVAGKEPVVVTAKIIDKNITPYGSAFRTGAEADFKLINGGEGQYCVETQTISDGTGATYANCYSAIPGKLTVEIRSVSGSNVPHPYPIYFDEKKEAVSKVEIKKDAPIVQKVVTPTTPLPVASPKPDGGTDTKEIAKLKTEVETLKAENENQQETINALKQYVGKLVALIKKILPFVE